MEHKRERAVEGNFPSRPADLARAKSNVYGVGASKYDEQTMQQWKETAQSGQDLLNSGKKERDISLRSECLHRAVELFFTAARLRPDFKKGYIGLSHALRQLNRFAEARDALQQGLEMCPEDGDLQRELTKLVDLWNIWKTHQAADSGDPVPNSTVPVAEMPAGQGSGNGCAGVSAAVRAATPEPSADLKVPHMEAELVDAITVPFDNIEADLQRVLDEHGAAIVTDILTQKQCQDMECYFADDLSALIDWKAVQKGTDVDTEARRVSNNKDANKWHNRVRDLPMGTQKLLGEMDRCQFRGLPHGRFAWEARRHERVRRVYEVLHNTDDLVSSCDNSFFAPSTHTAKKPDFNTNWPHVDHNIHDGSIFDANDVPISQWDVYQGVLYVWGSNVPRASTTVVWCGSHKGVYDQMMAAQQCNDHFCSMVKNVTPDVSINLNSLWRKKARRVPVAAGSLFLWNSRTVHQGWSDGPRLAQPVCWEPTNRRSEDLYHGRIARDNKMRMAALGLPSTHWASLGLPHKDKFVRTELSESTPASSSKEKGVALPLKASLRPVTLAPGVDLQEMWDLFATPDWKAPLPENLKLRLERSIDVDIAACL